ncbi:MAG: universal stress protein [Pseudoruegeria sp.]
MTYKSLLTISCDPETSKPALSTAKTLAELETAHLDVICLGIDHTQPVYFYGQGNALINQDMITFAREEAQRLETSVKQDLANEVFDWGCDSAATNIDGIARVVSLRAKFADLVVLPAPYGEGRTHAHEIILEAALFEGSAPILVIPENIDPVLPARRIAVAWNGSAEAMSAIRAALPMLKQAEHVSILIIDPPQHGPNRSDPGGALSQMLARHGVRADIAVLAKTLPSVSGVIARHIQDMDADLLVMGAYGHSRFREALLGGATRDMLEAAKIPVFMAR